jgi:hypothetical protein
VVTWLAVAAAAAAVPQALPTLADRGSEATAEEAHVRGTTPQMRRALADGAGVSMTVAALVRRIEASDVIVHLAPLDRPHTAFDGDLQFAAAAPGARYLRIRIRPELLRSELLAMIGHELQHAVEVAEAPSVVDGRSMEVLYRDIGYQHQNGHYETDAARLVAARVLFEAGGPMITIVLRPR